MIHEFCDSTIEIGIDQVHLRDAATEAHPLEHLVEGERNHERPDCTDVLGHPHGDPDDDGVEHYPNLQHLGHHLLLPPGLLLLLPRPLPHHLQHLMPTAMAPAADDRDLVAAHQGGALLGPEERHVIPVRVGAVPRGVRRGVLLVVVQEGALLGAHFAGEFEDGGLLGDRGVWRLLVAVAVAVAATVAVGLEVGRGGEVDEEREEGADEGEEPREGEVPPGPARGDGAVGERRLRVGEHVDERGGEDDPGRVALDEEEAPRVVGPAAERPRERDGEADADGAGDEDGQQGPRLEPRRRRAVPARPGARRTAAVGEAPGAGHGASGRAARTRAGRCSTKLPSPRRGARDGDRGLGETSWSSFDWEWRKRRGGGRRRLNGGFQCGVGPGNGAWGR